MSLRLHSAARENHLFENFMPSFCCFPSFYCTSHSIYTIKTTASPHRRTKLSYTSHCLWCDLDLTINTQLHIFQSFLFPLFALWAQSRGTKVYFPWFSLIKTKDKINRKELQQLFRYILKATFYCGMNVDRVCLPSPYTRFTPMGLIRENCIFSKNI